MFNTILAGGLVSVISCPARALVEIFSNWLFPNRVDLWIKGTTNEPS